MDEVGAYHWTGSELVVTHCRHGLDLRINPRCYLCDPLVINPDPPMVIRPYVGPNGSGGTTSTPWCSICAGWHIPGAGPCTATYSLGAQS